MRPGEQLYKAGMHAHAAAGKRLRCAIRPPSPVLCNSLLRIRPSICAEPGAYCSARDLNFEWANGHLSAYYGNKHSSLKSYAECCAACYNDPLCKAFTHYAKNSTCYFMDDGASTRAYSPGAQSGQLTQLKPGKAPTVRLAYSGSQRQ